MDTPHFFPINRCPVSVITFWIKEAQSGGIEGHTPTLERALGGRPKRHFRAAGRKFRAQGRAALSKRITGIPTLFYSGHNDQVCLKIGYLS